MKLAQLSLPRKTSATTRSGFGLRDTGLTTIAAFRPSAPAAHDIVYSYLGLLRSSAVSEAVEY